MIAVLLVFAQSAVSVPPARQATAAVRIERPAIAGARSWRDAPASSRREVRRVDERGREFRLRVIDYP